MVAVEPSGDFGREPWTLTGSGSAAAQTPVSGWPQGFGPVSAIVVCTGLVCGTWILVTQIKTTGGLKSREVGRITPLNTGDDTSAIIEFQREEYLDPSDLVRWIPKALRPRWPGRE